MTLDKSERSGKRRSEPERRCVLSGDTGAKETMIRFVMAPDGHLVPDLAESLPGRGVWIKADRAAFEEGLLRRRFIGGVARSLKQSVTPDMVDADLPDRIDRLLVNRVTGRLGLEKRAGRLVTGFEKVRAKVTSGRARILIEATDGAPDGRRKLRAAAGEAVAIVALLSRDQLGLALGGENVVHAAIMAGGGADRLLCEMNRLALWRGQSLFGALPDMRAEGVRAPE
ncbi:DNA-binding protein [Iodidimonas gelatinilytica]|uniref:DNA-binding protein n=1 Tax=Iodidimonas gelatinilytica TaxID=1236966 RepID=A0A5A7N1Z7_9PROT|nr:RNA-binding protein [Iodidimonas gelatinilytica]GER02138.1 DNA-binding protein [Iodidimonas gelatinilytica]